MSVTEDHKLNDSHTLFVGGEADPEVAVKLALVLDVPQERVRFRICPPGIEKYQRVQPSKNKRLGWKTGRSI